jgi:hypothetical protein
MRYVNHWLVLADEQERSGRQGWSRAESAAVLDGREHLAMLMNQPVMVDL